MSNQLIPVSDAVIVRQENISMIVQSGPQSYEANALSCRRCTDVGQQLLDEVMRCGMSDDLDRRLAAYIEKARKTVRVMNERRSPVTKLFDQVRSEFTSLENAIDPAKKDTLPYQLLQYRNAYAAKKHAEAEQRRQEALAAQELAKAKAEYKVEVENDYRSSFEKAVEESIRMLFDLNTCMSLINYADVVDAVTEYQINLTDDWRPASGVRQPYNLTAEEAKEIRDTVFVTLLPGFKSRFTTTVGDYRQEILDKLPSKKAELERIASANAADAARMKEELALRDAADAAGKEQERRQAEEAARQKAELDKANAEVAGLFAVAKAEQEYTPKAKVTKKIRIDDPSAFLAILSMWWQHEGCTLPVEELAKIFKKQLTFCERLANKDGIFAESAGLEYVDEVKAQ